MSPEHITELARQIAARMDPDALLDADDVAAMLKYSRRYVAEKLAAAPGFPRAVRLATSGTQRGDPRWRRSEIVAYIGAHCDGATKRGGRPRGDTAL